MNFHHLKLVQIVRRSARAMGLVRLLDSFRTHGAYESAFAAALKSSIRQADIVWDVGANVGCYTLQFVEWSGPEGLVFAFEPLPSAIDRLKCSIAASPHANRIKVVEMALSDVPGTACIAADADAKNEGGISTTAHLSGSPAETDPGENSIWVSVSTVDRMVADAELPPPTVTKIDVEGFEEEVLLGGAMAFSSSASRHIFIEVHFARLDERRRGDAPARIVRLLRSWGYHVRWADPSHLHASRRGA